MSRTVTPRRARFRLIIGGGTCALFLGFEPLAAKRFVQVRDQRTSLDYAHFIRWMCDEQDPDADQIILVQDNLNTHGPWSLYNAFVPEEAQRLCHPALVPPGACATRRLCHPALVPEDRVALHALYASWLNMAELELSVLSRQCLHERMENQHTLAQQVQAW